jgi:glycosyltransferase involved in cell wall biosynthesis
MSYASLCFLSYQRPAFLRQAITTALVGADEPVEVIIHDDGSTDPEVLRLIYTLHQRGEVSSIIMNAPGCNLGQGVALNALFHKASGDPIIKLDQDLRFRQGWLKTVKEILEDERVGLCALFKYEHDPVDWRKTIVTDVELLQRGIEHADLPRGYSFHSHICGSGMAIPRRVWEMLGPFEEGSEAFSEDAEFQRAVSDAGLFNALPDVDVVENVGFGIGPSTVAVMGENGQPTAARIHKYPMLVGGPA